jgi:hypothetical protein
LHQICLVLDYLWILRKIILTQSVDLH